jgi:HEAT repeat protein
MLVGLSAHRNAFLRATAIRGLAGLDEYEPLVVRALSDDSPQVVAAALGTLNDRQVRDHAPSLTVVASRLEREWAWPRRLAMQRLVIAGRPPSCDVLMAALAADGMSLGHDVIGALVSGCGRPVIPQLIGELRDGTRGRAAAAYVLGELRARESAADLAAVLGEDSLDLQVATACIEALGKIADPSAALALADAARHHQAWVRASALTALSKFDLPGVADAALAACEDFDPDVREKAVKLLAAQGDQRATARLLLFCDGQLAPVALKGLIRIADERAVPGLCRVFLNTGDRRIRHLAGRALAQSASRWPGLQHPGWWMTPPQIRAIAWVLGEIGDKNSSGQLSRLLAHRDELVRARAAAALGKIADQATAPTLHTALSDISPRVRANAATALGRLGASDAIQWLEPSLHDPHPAVRSAAEASLRHLRQR